MDANQARLMLKTNCVIACSRHDRAPRPTLQMIRAAKLATRILKAL